ncbi:MAG TPA: DNA double-strand break repair nuclease NurA [archaeon]|nr:DNA double-strand break repair nuclease NurA [archaeon]
MNNIGFVINSAVETIHSSEKRKQLVSQKLSPLKNKIFSPDFGLKEPKLVSPVRKWVPNGLIGGVDSGFVAKRLASLDIVLVRAVGVCFEYDNGIVKAAHYYPGFFRFPEPRLSNSALEEDEAEQSKSLLRLKEEVNASKKLILLHKPKYLFIDGSIVPQFQDKPRKESALTDNYIGIIKEFESLYELAEKNNCTLIATVEDSRGSRFRQIVQEQILSKDSILEPEKLEGMFDSAFLDYFLGVNERSCVFNYTKNIKQHPVLQDFSPEWSENIFGLYIKPTEYDRPLRVEFIAKGNVSEKADEIASVAFALSSLHREYAYPSVLIEADMRAKLKPDEIEIVYNKIMDKLGNSIKLKMRRDNRPF